MGPMDGANEVLFSKRYDFGFELCDSKWFKSCSYLTGIIAAVTPVKYELGILYVTVYPWCTVNNFSTTTEQYLYLTARLHSSSISVNNQIVNTMHMNLFHPGHMLSHKLS